MVSLSVGRTPEPADNSLSESLLGTEALLTAQKQSLEMVVRGAPLGEVLAYLARIVERHAGQEVFAAILLLDSDGCLHTGAVPSLPDAFNDAIDGLKATPGVGTCSRAAATGEVVITPDIAADPRWTKLKSLPLKLGLKAAWSQPIVSRSGRVLGTFGTYFREHRKPTDLERQLVGVLSHTAALAIERKEADSLLEKQSRLYDTALAAAEMGTWQLSLVDEQHELSPEAQQFYGVDSAQFHHDEKKFLRHFHPDDIPLRQAALSKACDPAGDGRYSAEYRVRRPDGGWRWLSAWGLVEFEGEGKDRRPAAMVGASRDITRRKEAEEKQHLLIQELSHRVKNTLAIVRSIADQTLRQTPDPAEFKAAFSARISALARAHALLTSTRWQGTPLDELLSITTKPFRDTAGADVFRIEGPEVRVDPNAAVTLSLVFHELATNAAKYGALSSPAGRVSVGWSIAPGNPTGAQTVELRWHETGGPAVRPTDTRGFGFRLIDVSAAQLGGEAAIEFAPVGVAFRLTFTLEGSAAV